MEDGCVRFHHEPARPAEGSKEEGGVQGMKRWSLERSKHRARRQKASM